MSHDGNSPDPYQSPAEVSGGQTGNRRSLALVLGIAFLVVFGGVAASALLFYSSLDSQVIQFGGERRAIPRQVTAQPNPDGELPPVPGSQSDGVSSDE